MCWTEKHALESKKHQATVIGPRGSDTKLYTPQTRFAHASS
jgi:hypothetical protein